MFQSICFSKDINMSVYLKPGIYQRAVDYSAYYFPSGPFYIEPSDYIISCVICEKLSNYMIKTGLHGIGKFVCSETCFNIWIFQSI
jgi:hypothetical protein